MENSFDKEIKKALENYEAEYKPMDWDQMEQMIEEDVNLSPDLEDVYLDGMAFDNLHNLSVDYNPEHWDLMKEKLADPFALRRRLMKYKVLEVALVLLFIFTLFQFLPIKKVIHRDIANSSNTFDINKSELSSKTNFTDLVVINSIIDPPNGSYDYANTELQNTQGTNKVNTPYKNTVAQINNVTTPVPTNILSENQKNTIDVSKEPSSDLTDNTAISKSIVNQNPSVQEALVNTDLLNPILLKKADKLLKPDLGELNSSPIFSDLKKPIKIRIGMALGPDANYVMTSANPTRQLESFNQFALGYSGGFTLGFRYNKWEIETGALYSAVNYNSRNIFEIKGSFAEGGYVQQGFDGAELDLIRLPLNLKYNFFEKKKWNVYAFSGATLNLAVETFYNFTTQDVGESDASRNFVNPRIPDEFQNDLNKTSYNGILEGGRLLDNTFLTANFGFGIERYFTPRMSIFLQPSYMQQFSKGLGPQSDQINSISILTGAKVTLKKKRNKLKK